MPVNPGIPDRNPAPRLRFDVVLLLVCAAVFSFIAVQENGERVPEEVWKKDSLPPDIRGFIDSGPRGIWFGDIPYYILTVRSLVEDRDLDLRNQLHANEALLSDSIGLGKDGEWYSTHPVLMPVVSIPFYLLFGINGFLLFNVAVLVGIVIVMFRLAGLYATAWTSFAAALVFAFLTQIRVTVYNFSPDTFSTLVALLAILYLLKEKTFAAGVLWGLALLSRTTNIVPYLAVFPFLWTGRTPLKGTLRFMAGSVPFLVLFLCMNRVQYGGFFTLSYSRLMMLTYDGLKIFDVGGQFALENAAGLWQQIVDRDHGLLYNNAVALIGGIGFVFLFRRSWRSAALILLVAASIYVFHGFFRLWWLSHPGSNRYLFTTVCLMAVPFACLLSGLLAGMRILRPKGRG